MKRAQSILHQSKMQASGCENEKKGSRVASAVDGVALAPSSFLSFAPASPDAAPMYGLQLGADVNAAPHGCVLVHLYASARSIEQAAENVKRLRALAHALTTPLDEAAAAAAALDARSSSASRACSRWEATNSGWLAATLLLALLHPVLPRHFCSRLVPPPASPSGWTTVSSRRNACSACCILP